MSNTTMGFLVFKARADADKAKAPHLAIVATAQLSFATAVQTVAASWMTLPLAKGTYAALVIAQLVADLPR